MRYYNNLCLQDDFVPQGKACQIHFTDGRVFPGLHQRYLMVHAGSKGKVSASQMWDFIQSVGNSDLGRIKRYKNKAKLSQRMLKMTKKVYKNFPHMLQDIPG